MSKKAIVNTSCLIALSNIGMLDILCKLYGEVIIPSAVMEEFGEIRLNCMKIEKVENPLVELFVNRK